ncbi:MAG: AMP-binding protein [Acidobacteria bacterium]|nr:AMP-binding protein [Acidobacteriota bacterium]
MLDGCTPWPEEFVRRYVREGYWQNKTLGELLEDTARAFPDKTAVADGARKVSYSDLSRLSTRLAVHLLKQGLQPGDIVLLQLPNVWEFVVVFFALHKIGVIPVLCLPPHRHTELTYFARLTGAAGYFLAPEFRGFDYLAMAKEIQQEVPSLQHVIAVGEGTEKGVSYTGPWLTEPDETAVPPDFLARHRPDPFDVALFLLSGGTTGIPKLIPRTHADYIYNARQCAEVLRCDPEMVLLVVIPAAHNFPLASPGMIGAVAVGGSVAMCPSTDPEKIFQAIQTHQATFLPLSPALLITLLNSPHREKYDLRSLRFVCVGGQKMLPELVDRTWAAWDYATPGHAFGMAEGLVNLTRPGDTKEVIRQTQGRPASPAEEIKVVDEEGREVPPGEVGELLTRGPYTIRGYYKAEEHNRVAFTPDGFYATGDMVRMHPSGNLVVEGRRKDMINRGGEKISAEEVENLILSHEGVLNAAVVAMPDPILGERTCAFVILRLGRTLTLEELVRFLAGKRIAKFKLPERLEIVEAFPLTSVGKVSKKDLRARIASKLKAEENLSAGAKAN